MGFFSKLLGKNAWKKTLIRDLVILSAVDGDMDKEEVSLVMKIAVEELGFSQQNFVDLMQNLGDVKDIYPENNDDKLEFLKYLLQMTYVDGCIDDNEVEYMKIVAQRMNLPASGIDQAIAHVESISEKSSSYLEENDNDFSDDANSTKTVLTSPISTVPELQSAEGLRHYLLRLSKLSHSDLCLELSNVLAAKHNLMFLPSHPKELKETQEKVTDLTDKAVAICMHEFGQEIIMNYGNRDLTKFNELVNTIDAEVAQENLYPEQHGRKMLNKLRQALA